MDSALHYKLMNVSRRVEVGGRKVLMHLEKS